ncbi:MAG: helix-turn-helix transcriptional regulator [Nevskia sp.]|nr:helix-turn-helix transcriptional regulator [Nevskia sp.]
MRPEIAFGKVLRSLRLEIGKTQETLAFDADLQRHYISLLERGSSSPTLKTIFCLANALNISPDQLVSLVVVELQKNKLHK